MDLSGVELDGRAVLIVGSAASSRHTAARCIAAGAAVTLASDGPETAHVAVAVVPTPPDLESWRALVSAHDLVIAIGRTADHGSADYGSADHGSADHGPTPVHGMLRAACSLAEVLLSTAPAASVSPMGHVTLAGGGPGDAGLMTTASVDALRSADVILYDRLGPSVDLADLAPGAELIDVGKTPGHHAVPQGEIEALLIDHASRGRAVVRLKGGDPFVFGRGGEEVVACRAAGVQVTVIAGVTSAIAVPGAAGIPVTHRDISRMFTVISGHVPLSEAELGHLVGLDSTIVVLMGVGTLPQLAAGLRRQGMRDDMPVAIIERGFSASRRTTSDTVGGIVELASRVGVRSPAVLVIGEVVRWAASADVAAVELFDSAALLMAEE